MTHVTEAEVEALCGALINGGPAYGDVWALRRKAADTIRFLAIGQTHIWNEFVFTCEQIEAGSGKKLTVKKISRYEAGYWNGQASAANAIRHSVDHPKYAARVRASAADGEVDQAVLWLTQIDSVIAPQIAALIRRLVAERDEARSYAMATNRIAVPIAAQPKASEEGIAAWLCETFPHLFTQPNEDRIRPLVRTLLARLTPAALEQASEVDVACEIVSMSAMPEWKAVEIARALLSRFALPPVGEVERLRQQLEDAQADVVRLHKLATDRWDALLELQCRDKRDGMLSEADRKIIDDALCNRQGDDGERLPAQEG